MTTHPRPVVRKFDNEAGELVLVRVEDRHVDARGRIGDRGVGLVIRGNEPIFDRKLSRREAEQLRDALVEFLARETVGG